MPQLDLGPSQGPCNICFVHVPDQTLKALPNVERCSRTRLTAAVIHENVFQKFQFIKCSSHFFSLGEDGEWSQEAPRVDPIRARSPQTPGLYVRKKLAFWENVRETSFPTCTRDLCSCSTSW